MEVWNRKIKEHKSDNRWLIIQNKYKREENKWYESLFCLSNGYSSVRGSYEEGNENGLPAVFNHGIFDQSNGLSRELVNLPNWLGVKLYYEKSLIGMDTCEVMDFYRILDMKNAVLLKYVILRDQAGRETKLETIRFLSRKKCTSVRNQSICDTS